MHDVLHTLRELGRDGLLAPIAVVVAASITGSVAWRALSQADRHHNAALEKQTERMKAELDAARERQLADLAAQRAAVRRQELREAIIECSTVGRAIVMHLSSNLSRMSDGARPDDDDVLQTRDQARPVGFANAALQLAAEDGSPIAEAYFQMFAEAMEAAGYISMAHSSEHELDEMVEALRRTAQTTNDHLDRFLVLARAELTGSNGA